MKRQVSVKTEDRPNFKLNQSPNRKARQKNGYDFMVKVIMVGDSGVGKTNIITRFCTEEGDQFEFKDYHVATIGVDFSTKIMQIDNRKLKLQIWDTAGQERFRTITETYYKGAGGIILVYAVNSQDSFLKKWVEQVKSKSAEHVKKVLIANKIDVQDCMSEENCDQQPRKVSRQRGLAMAEKHNMEYYEVSAKYNEGIVEMFESLGRSIKQSIETSSVTNGAEDLSLTITLDSKYTKSMRRVKKQGVEYQVQVDKSLLTTWKERLCGC